VRLLRGVVLVAVVAAVSVAVFPSASAPAALPGYRVLFSGNPPGGGFWDLSARKRTISGLPSLCLSFTTKTPDGVEASSNGCGGGTLRAWKNVFPVSFGAGGDDNMNLIGGFTVARARKAVITFVDGKRVTVATRLGPPAFRRALGERIRFIVLNASARTKAAARWVSVFDSRGRRIGRQKLGA
jgi:hypothetical protein